MKRKRPSWRRCPHVCTIGIYGDEINQAIGYRLQCLDCGRLLDGPVAWATHRNCTTEPTCPKHREATS